jgi:hypothetical protein
MPTITRKEFEALPKAVKAAMKKQIARDVPPPPVLDTKHAPFEGKEKDLQEAVEGLLEDFGFCRRTSKAILADDFAAWHFTGWQFHLSRAPGNPYLLDIVLLHERSGRFLEIELKTAKGDFSPIQRVLLKGRHTRVARSLEEAREVVETWLKIVENA